MPILPHWFFLRFCRYASGVVHEHWDLCETRLRTQSWMQVSVKRKNTAIYINWQAKSHKYRMLLFCISYLSDNIAFLYLSENIFLYLHENIVILHLSEIFVNKRILFRVLNLGGKVPSYLYWWYNTWHTTCIFIRWIKLFPTVLI